MGGKLILVTGARSPAALDIARDFARLGHEVHMADSSGARISRWSNAPAAVHRIRPPVQDANGFRRDMSYLVRRFSPELVVPACEEAFHLAAARADGVNVGPLLSPDPETLDVLHAKDRFNALARDLGLDAPETSVHTDGIDPDAIDLPRTVLKACYSRFGDGTFVSPTRDQALRVRPTPSRPWVAQRLVEGVEHSSYAVAVDGRVTAFAAYRSIMRMGGGAGYAFRPAAPDVAARMLDATRTVAEALEMTGQISLDAIDDGRRAWLLECNPRATSGAHLIAGEGHLANSMLGHGNVRDCRARDRHNLPMTITHGLVRRRGAERLTRDALDVVGAPGDRLPLLGAAVDTLAFAIIARRHGTSMTAATTRDIEWNGGRS